MSERIKNCGGISYWKRVGSARASHRGHFLPIFHINARRIDVENYDYHWLDVCSIEEIYIVLELNSGEFFFNVSSPNRQSLIPNIDFRRN